MPSITTLVPDMYEYLREARDTTTKALPDMRDAFERQVAGGLRATPTPSDPVYASEYGSPCIRKLWYKRNEPSEALALDPWVRMKFILGDAIEELALCIAANAGHDVAHEQERVALKSKDGTELVSGRLDAIIDGHVVDVKSMSPFAFNKYKRAGWFIKPEEDTFGYRWQLAFYHHLAVERGWVEPDSTPYFLAIEKSLGKIAMFEVGDLPTKAEVANKVAFVKGMIEQDSAPERPFSDMPDGASGNRKLGIECSYCDFKKHCWPGLRTFHYSTGPRFLTKVKKTPAVPEGVLT